MDWLAWSAADVCIACVLWSECGQDRGTVGDPKVVETVHRASRLLRVSSSGLGGDGDLVVQKVPNEIEDGSDARATKGDGIGLSGSHGNIKVGFVCR